MTFEDLLPLRNEVMGSIKIESYRDQVIASFMARLLGLTDDIQALVLLKQYSAIEILMRSVLETYIELKCTLQDLGYIETLELNAQLEKRKYFSQYKSDNPFYAETTSNEVDAILASIPNKRPLSIFDKFKKVNEVDAYNTLYAHFCRFSHGGLQALASKHYDGNNVVIQKSPSPDWMKFVEESSFNVVVATLKDVSEHFNLSRELISKLEAHVIKYA